MKELKDLPFMLEAKHLQALTGLSKNTVYEMMRNGDFPAIKASKGRYLVPRDAFFLWLQEQSGYNFIGENKKD